MKLLLIAAWLAAFTLNELAIWEQSRDHGVWHCEKCKLYKVGIYEE